MTTLQRRAGTTLWRRIAEQLSGEIAGGAYKAGDRLPTEHKLAEHFGVNRHTVRQAMSSLEESGLVQVEQGRGMFVANRPVDYRIGSRTRFSEQLQMGHHKPVRRLLEGWETRADAHVARELELPEGTGVWRLEIVSSADDRPFSHSVVFFPLERFPDLPDIFGQELSVTRTFAHFGVTDYRRRTTRITARTASTRDVELLGVMRGKPVLVTESVDVDADGVPVTCGTARISAENVVLMVEG